MPRSSLVTDLDDPATVIARPGGHFLAPWGEERVGDVSNVVFVNGATVDENGLVKIYYASSDTRIHVATSDLDRLLDYAFRTPKMPSGPPTAPSSASISFAGTGR